MHIQSCPYSHSVASSAGSSTRGRSSSESTVCMRSLLSPVSSLRPLEEKVRSQGDRSTKSTVTASRDQEQQGVGGEERKHIFIDFGLCNHTSSLDRAFGHGKQGETFKIEELRLMILQHLDPASLLDLSRVSKSFHNYIYHTEALKRQLFLEHSPAGRSAKTCPIPGFVYEGFDNFTYIGPSVFYGRPLLAQHRHTVLVNPILVRAEDSDERVNVTLRTLSGQADQVLHLRISPDDESSIGPRIREMFITNPPANRVTLVLYFKGTGIHPTTHRAIFDTSPSGVRNGDFIRIKPLLGAGCVVFGRGSDGVRFYDVLEAIRRLKKVTLPSGDLNTELSQSWISVPGAEYIE